MASGLNLDYAISSETLSGKWSDEILVQQRKRFNKTHIFIKSGFFALILSSSWSTST